MRNPAFTLHHIHPSLLARLTLAVASIAPFLPDLLLALAAAGAASLAR
jgi:hypothetical protein